MKLKLHKKYRQVSFLHHLPLARPLSLGRFTLWPYYKCRNTFIKEDAVRGYLDKLFSRMRDYQNRPLKHIAILSSSVPPRFESASAKVSIKMKNALNALFFAAVCRNGPSGAISSDNFNLIGQNFIPGDDAWAVTDGSYIQITIGGLKLKNAGVRLPPRATHLREFIYDEALLAGCLRCAESGESCLQRRIFPSLEWMAYSYDNAPRVPYLNRVLLLMISFEMLANCPGSFTAVKFAEWLEKVWNVPQDRKVSRRNEKIGPYGPLGWWGVGFYRLRNDIVHNKRDLSKVSFFDSYNREYFKTGVFVFSECMKEILAKEGFFEMPPFTNEIRAWQLRRKDKASEA